jgi:hypothetical protein
MHAATSIADFIRNTTTTESVHGAINGVYFVVNTGPRLGEAFFGLPRRKRHQAKPIAASREAIRIKDNFEGTQSSMAHRSTMQLRVPIDSRQSPLTRMEGGSYYKRPLRLETNTCMSHMTLAGPLGSGELRVRIPVKWFLARSLIFTTPRSRGVSRSTRKRRPQRNGPPTRKHENNIAHSRDQQEQTAESPGGIASVAFVRGSTRSCHEDPPHNLSRDVIKMAIKEQGFQLWRLSNHQGR